MKQRKEVEDVRKSDPISFQIQASDFENKEKADRFFTLYRQLRKNRELLRFSREACIEKADRYLSGLEKQYALLDHHIKTKGIFYILEAIREKEMPKSEDTNIEKNMTEALQVLLKVFQNGLQASQVASTLDTQNSECIMKAKPDLEKLKGLL